MKASRWPGNKRQLALFNAGRRSAILACMRTVPQTFATWLAGATALTVAAGAAGLAFAGWMDHAPGIFMALVEQGMAWCF